MSIKLPLRNLINPDGLGILICSEPKVQPSAELELNLKLVSGQYELTDLQTLAWQNSYVTSLIETPKWRQILLITFQTETFEVALANMALATGFQVFIACPGLVERSLSVASVA